MSRQPAIAPSPRDACRILFRHQRKASFVFALTLALAVVAVVMCPRTYVSEAKLIVRLGRASVALDPTATTGQTVGIQTSRESEINSVLEILRSRMILELVVDRLGVAELLPPTPESDSKTPSQEGSDAKEPGSGTPSTGEPSPDEPGDRPVVASLLDQVLAPLAGLDPVSDRERAVTSIAESVEIGAAKNSNVITITCETDDPHRARAIVSTITEVCRDEHLRLNHTEGSFDFFAQQTNLLERELATASEKLRDAKNEFELVSVESERKLLDTELGVVTEELLLTEAALETSKAKAEALRERLGQLADRLVMEEESGFSNEAADGMRQQLYSLEIREGELIARYAEDHPFVVAIRKQIDDVKRIIEAEDPERMHSVTGVNPVYQQLQAAMVDEQAVAASLAAKTVPLLAKKADLDGRLQRLNNEEVLLAQLERQVQLLDAKYRTYSEYREQSRIDQELQAERISNINVVQAATLMEKPVRPKKGVMLGLGLLMATAGALGIAVLAEYVDHSFTTSTEVEEKLGLPVLMAIPNVPRRELTLN